MRGFQYGQAMTKTAVAKTPVSKQSDQAGQYSQRVALATCADVGGFTVDDKALVPALASRAIEAVPAVWNDPSIDWDSFDLVVVRSTWDYSTQREEYAQWTRRVPRLANSAEVIEWSMDRRYMREMERVGIPVIDTIWLDPQAHLSKRAVHYRMPAFGDFVVKPIDTVGARDVGRYQPISAASRAQAISHAMRLLDAGRWVMIQPYMTQIDELGETCLIFINGQFQHAIRRNGLLGSTHRETVGLGLYNNKKVQAVEPTDQQLDVAQRALDFAVKATGAAQPFLYARVDVAPGPTGPLVMELELNEPGLWMKYSENNATAEHFADAIAAQVSAAQAD